MKLAALLLGWRLLRWVLPGLVVAVTCTGVTAQDAPLSLELVEVVPDPVSPKNPVVTSGHVSGVDPYYGNFTADYNWSEPPAVVGPEGFTLTLQTQSENRSNGGTDAGTSANGTGFDLDPKESVAWAKVPPGKPGSNAASLSVRVTPTGIAWGDTAELWIGAAYGAGVTYRYRAADRPPEDGTADDPGQPPEEQRQLTASVECDSTDIVISALPSLSCRLLISGWTRNTSVPVSVELPAATDGYGNHANGLQLSLTTGGSQDVYEWSEPVYVWPFGAFGCAGQQGAGVNCYGNAMVPGVPATVPIVVRQGEQQVMLNLTLNAVARDGGEAGGAGTGPYRFGNLRMAGDFLNVENGALASSYIKGDWLSALWTIEPTGDGFYRIHNVWKPDVYLHVENQIPEAGPIHDDWLSAQWTFESVEGTRYFRIRSRWMDGQYLYTDAGYLAIGPVTVDMTGALWWLME